MDDPVSSLDILTLVIAIVGAVAGLLSLGWQALSWFLTGPVVKVSIGEGIFTMTDGTLGPDVVYVRAMNRGRSEVSVTAWAIKLPSGRTFVQMQPAPWTGRRCPHTLAGKHDVTWYSLRTDLAQAVARDGLRTASLHGVVSLGGSGKDKVSRGTINLTID